VSALQKALAFDLYRLQSAIEHLLDGSPLYDHVLKAPTPTLCRTTTLLTARIGHKIPEIAGKEFRIAHLEQLSLVHQTGIDKRRRYCLYQLDSCLVVFRYVDASEALLSRQPSGQPGLIDEDPGGKIAVR
jgi:hypothetical protein